MWYTVEVCECNDWRGFFYPLWLNGADAEPVLANCCSLTDTVWPGGCFSMTQLSALLQSSRLTTTQVMLTACFLTLTHHVLKYTQRCTQSPPSHDASSFSSVILSHLYWISLCLFLSSPCVCDLIWAELCQTELSWIKKKKEKAKKSQLRGTPWKHEEREKQRKGRSNGAGPKPDNLN